MAGADAHRALAQLAATGQPLAELLGALGHVPGAAGEAQGRRRGQGTAHGTRGELLLYALHGLLHAAGHDDQDDASYRRMHAEEDRILDAAGFGRIFEGGQS